jgi:hypothetical protein
LNRWKKRWSPLLLIVCAGAFVLGLAGHAFAVELHAFDPLLSLTGNCEVEEVDPVADPGLCPIPPGTVFTGEPGADHPSARFNNPAGIATDSYGNIYVSSLGKVSAEGRIDIFDSMGHFITELADSNGPGSMAVDSEGNLYVANRLSGSEENVVHYSPTPTSKPSEGLIEYETTPEVLVPKGASGTMGLAINRSNDHLFVKFSVGVKEYKSVAEGNGLIEEWGEFSGDAAAIAVDAAHNRIFINHRPAVASTVEARELAPPHALLFKIEGSAVPNGEFISNLLSLAVDEGTGHVFVYDSPAKKVYEFDSSGVYLGAIEHSFDSVEGAEIAVDNGANSPNGALNLFGRYLYVPSNTTRGHSYAFGPPDEGEPIIESISFANVGEAEAELQASIEPFGLETHYTFEYITQRQYEKEGNGFAGAQLAGEGDIPAGNSPIDVATPIEGLEAETRYRFRVFAENALGSDEEEGEFATFPAAEPFPTCPNDALRTGFSALLPDCRAYELVTPPDTNARSPHGVNNFLPSGLFATRETSPQGNQVSFEIEGGVIPGSKGTGSLAGDPYLSSRGEGGWGTSYVGPSASEAPAPLPGSHSPDQQFSFWTSGGGGSSDIEGKNTTYVRYPDGHSSLVGRGSIADDSRAGGKLISEGGGHIVFFSGGNNPAIQLEPDAPPSGTQTIYDRTADEVTHVVSLLPGDETPAAGQDATYAGASLDGKGVAFTISNKLYLRFDNEETYELGEGVTFAGIAEGGNRAFYLEGGQLWRFDATTEERTEFSSVPVTPVNVAANGSVAYFVSQSVLTSEPNPNGAVAQGGEENLYRSEEGAISLVGTVTERDVKGASNGSEVVGGLGLWTAKVGAGSFAADPSRTTPDGGALLFESRAVLDGYDPEGHAEVYRYDFSGNELDCLSCNPTLAPASSDASLQSIASGLGAPEPLGPVAAVSNLPFPGRAFFQSNEALVPGDTDGLQDVYEWEAKGVGSCKREGGCIYLISSGNSLRIDYLYATSDSGDDVFFRTADILLSRDAEETPSIYDARLGGGFAEECPSGQCEPPLPPPSSGAAPDLSNPVTQGTGASGNISGKVCRKGTHKVKIGGKVRCVKKHRKHHHRKAGSKKRGGRGK